MKKTVLAALVFSVFGTGTALAASCGDPRHGPHSWQGFGNCHPCEDSEPNDRLGKLYWIGACGPCPDTCIGYGSMSLENSLSPVKIRALEIAKSTIQPSLKFHSDNALGMALEIAEKNPRAAVVFIGMHTMINKLDAYVEENSKIWGPGDPVGAIFTKEKAKEFIKECHATGNCDAKKYYDENSKIKYQYEWYLREVANGEAYIKIKIASMDKNQREIAKILPDIRINLRKASDGSADYWQPISWKDE